MHSHATSSSRRGPTVLVVLFIVALVLYNEVWPTPSHTLLPLTIEGVVEASPHAIHDVGSKPTLRFRIDAVSAAQSPTKPPPPVVVTSSTPTTAVNGSPSPGNSSSSEKGRTPSPAPPVRCPARHPADHGLVNTGRRALVFYTFTSHDNLQDRQIELDNYLFFQAHGVVAPDTPTALFSAVDYIVLRSDLERDALHNGSVRECGPSSSANVRFVETPSGPCDLCGIARTIKALGGVAAVAESYEYIVVVNSGTRGPFYSEAPRSAGGPSPVTWIDHLALGGEKVYTGAIMTGSGGSADRRPFLFSFAFGAPSSALFPLMPVLMAGCIEARIPPLWYNYVTSYDIDLHKDIDQRQAIRVLDIANQRRSIPPPIRHFRSDNPATRAAKILVERRVAEGFAKQVRTTNQIIDDLRHGGNIVDPWENERKMRCVFRCEIQLMKTLFDSRLPPSSPTQVASTTPQHRASGTQRVKHQPRRRQRPHLTSAQKAQLSPVVSGYLHEEHYFVRSLHHNETMVNMGHASIVMHRSGEEIGRGDHFTMDACDAVFLKFGGAGWRKRQIPASVLSRVQELTLLQIPPTKTAEQLSRQADFAQVLHCSAPHDLRPLNTHTDSVDLVVNHPLSC